MGLSDGQKLPKLGNLITINSFRKRNKIFGITTGFWQKVNLYILMVKSNHYFLVKGKVNLQVWLESRQHFPPSQTGQPLSPNRTTDSKWTTSGADCVLATSSVRIRSTFLSLFLFFPLP